MIGKIERVKLREVWKHEALDFTRWLEENIDVLNDVLNISLSETEREQKAGAFSVDIIAEDDAGNVVVIENQLEKSDHDHLGKLITYLVAMDAKVAIWIVSEPRPEHVNAITWLNEASSASFYLLKLEAVKIGNSTPAPLLTLIVGPSEEAREVGKTKKEMVERHFLRKQFWEGLLEKAKSKTKLHSGISSSNYNWIGAGSGVGGVGFNYSVRQHDAQVELYIDQDRESAEGKGNKLIFDKLHEHKDKIESVFGGPLNWERLDQRRACRISKVIPIAGYRDEEKWPEAHDVLVDAMIKLDQALKPFLKRMKLPK